MSNEPSLFQDQERRRPDATQGQKVVYDAAPEQTRAEGLASVDLSEKQKEYLWHCFAVESYEFSGKKWNRRRHEEHTLWESHQVGLTDAEAAQLLGWLRSSVNGRRNELVQKGVIQARDERECRRTGNTAIAWAPVRDLFRSSDKG